MASVSPLDRWSVPQPSGDTYAPAPSFEELYGQRLPAHRGREGQGWAPAAQGQDTTAPAKVSRRTAMASVIPSLWRSAAKETAVTMVDMTMARHAHVPPSPHAMSFAQLDMYANFSPVASSSQSALARDAHRRKPLHALQPALGLQPSVSIASTSATISASSTSSASASASAPSTSDSSARSSDRDSVFTATTASTGSGSASSFTLPRDNYVPTYGRGGAARHYARQAGAAGGGGHHSCSASTIGACDTQSLMSEFLHPFDTQAVGKSGGKVFLEGLLSKVKRDKGKAKAREGALVVETRLDGTWTSKAAEAEARAEGKATQVYGRGGAGRMASMPSLRQTEHARMQERDHVPPVPPLPSLPPGPQSPHVPTSGRGGAGSRRAVAGR